MSALIDTERQSASKPLVEVKHLKKYFPIRTGLFSKVVGNVRAVDDISFAINPGETFGLVGESGCGKSTLGRVMLRLQDATAGEVNFDGRNLLKMNPQELRSMRKEMQVIFQDPFGSLNPRFTVGDIIGEPLRVHSVASGKDRDDRVAELLERVGLSATWRNRYPHEFSGGQRQRIGIARALALNPRFIVADEAVSALDVSVQSQVINLLSDLQEQMGLTYLFIAHGLNVVKHISTRIGVMYLGKMVEVATSEELFARPSHPYSAALLSSAPMANPRQRRERIILKGDVPSPANPPSGCRFHTRCPIAQPVCSQQEPVLQQVSSGHWAACHFPLA